jgi:hypothetical protein
MDLLTAERNRLALCWSEAVKPNLKVPIALLEGQQGDVEAELEVRVNALSAWRA